MSQNIVKLLQRGGERYAGVGSKQTVVKATSANTVVVKVDSNFSADHNDPVGPKCSLVRSGLVENLIIDGQGFSGTTGLLLENVCGSFVRNVTIRNCDVGILFRTVDDLPHTWTWSETSCLQHIRLVNVKKGILFSVANFGYSFGHSYIDDVDIFLRDGLEEGVGIQIGDNPTASISARPYFSFLKANIYLGSGGGCGVRLVNGELKHGLINVGVYGKGSAVNRVGIEAIAATVIDKGARVPLVNVVEKNQTNTAGTMKGCFLYAENLTHPVKIDNHIIKKEDEEEEDEVIACFDKLKVQYVSV